MTLNIFRIMKHLIISTNQNIIMYFIIYHLIFFLINKLKYQDLFCWNVPWLVIQLSNNNISSLTDFEKEFIFNIFVIMEIFPGFGGRKGKKTQALTLDDILQNLYPTSVCTYIVYNNNGLREFYHFYVFWTMTLYIDIDRYKFKNCAINQYEESDKWTWAVTLVGKEVDQLGIMSRTQEYCPTNLNLVDLFPFGSVLINQLAYLFNSFIDLLINISIV